METTGALNRAAGTSTMPAEYGFGGGVLMERPEIILLFLGVFKRVRFLMGIAELPLTI